ncbi:MAG: hypothetical protein K0S89_601 [Nitrososphaeraceae archaeon]|jgi:hypothetical protein|nr:hypothetical protein [Nitrososphaeraceae archaeon]
MALMKLSKDFPLSSAIAAVADNRLVNYYAVFIA